ncbi:MAG TPA: valine--tRNA ligase, partial [Clostridia bacterium]
DPDVLESFQAGAPFVQRLAQVSSITCRPDAAGIPDSAVTAVFDGGTIYLPLEDLIDLAKERERLEKERENAERERDRVLQKLENAEFTSRAPARVVDAEREKLTRYGQMLADLETRLKAMDG